MSFPAFLNAVSKRKAAAVGRFILFGFVAMPLLEIAMFVVVGRAIGLLPTLGLVVLAMVVGAAVLRQQGIGAISRMRSSVNTGALPGRTMFDAMLIGVAGLLLIIPGFLSDIVAILLLIPPLRGFIFTQLTKNMTVVETTASYRRQSDDQGFPSGPQRTIDLDKDDWRKED